MLALVIIETVIALAWLFLYAWRGSENWNMIVRFFMATSVMGINIFQIPMQIHLQESYALTIGSVWVWFILAVSSAGSFAFKKGREG